MYYILWLIKIIYFIKLKVHLLNNFTIITDFNPSFLTNETSFDKMDQCRFVFICGPRKGEQCNELASINGFCTTCIHRTGARLQLEEGYFIPAVKTKTDQVQNNYNYNYNYNIDTAVNLIKSLRIIT